MATAHGEVVIAILGVTGAGKSSLVKRVTNRNDIYVEDGLSSGTEEVQAYKFRHNGIDFVIVDTPGFNDSRTSNDGKVVSNLLSWLEVSYKQGSRLNGLIYLHRISDPRMAGSAMKNLSMFRKLCGSDNFKNVVLGTTFWDKVDASTGEERERELATSNEMWGSMVKKGSKLVRVLENQASNLAIFEDIARNNGKIVVEAQKEMLAGKSRLDTAAALDLGTKIHEFREEQRQERIRELIRLQNDEKKREQARQQQLVAVQAETDRKRRATQERAEKEERLRREQLEREIEAQHRREKREREEMKAEATRLEALANAVRKKQQDQEAKRRYWREHVCDNYMTYKQHCSNCGGHLHKKKSYYYHCCFCNHDNYNSCSRCGSRCLDKSHPPMKTRSTVDKDSCTVM